MRADAIGWLSLACVAGVACAHGGQGEPRTGSHLDAAFEQRVSDFRRFVASIPSCAREATTSAVSSIERSGANRVSVLGRQNMVIGACTDAPAEPGGATRPGRCGRPCRASEIPPAPVWWLSRSETGSAPLDLYSFETAGIPPVAGRVYCDPAASDAAMSDIIVIVTGRRRQVQSTGAGDGLLMKPTARPALDVDGICRVVKFPPNVPLS